MQPSALQTGPWVSDGSEITGTNNGWESVFAGLTDYCWFTGPNDYASLLLTEVFVPDASSELTFSQFAILAGSRFQVHISTNGGNSFTTLYTTPQYIYEDGWTLKTISLSDYAGQQIRLRFVLTQSNSYYLRDWAGIRIDDLEITADYSPTGIVDDGDGMPDAWEELYGLDTNINDADLDPDNDGFSNYEEYVCGTVPTNAASYWQLGLGAGSLPDFYAITSRLYTIEYCTNLADDVWVPLASDIPGSNGTISVGNYDAATNAGRFYRVQVREQ